MTKQYIITEDQIKEVIDHLECGFDDDSDAMTVLMLQSLPELIGPVWVTSPQPLNDRMVTHAEGCHTWGPSHYECAKRNIVEMEAQLVDAQKDAWQPIETAPDNQLVVVFWTDNDDAKNPERHDFDYLEDGVWQNYFNRHEHYLIAGAARGRSEDAPFTHWMPLPKMPIDAAMQPKEQP